MEMEAVAAMVPATGWEAVEERYWVATAPVAEVMAVAGWKAVPTAEAARCPEGMAPVTVAPEAAEAKAPPAVVTEVEVVMVLAGTRELEQCTSQSMQLQTAVAQGEHKRRS